MKRGRAAAIHDEVRGAVSRWSGFAERAGVDPIQSDQISKTLRVELPKD
jgi:hypothetical protein